MEDAIKFTKEKLAAETERDKLREKLTIANAKLGARPFLEATEARVVPPWLRNAKWLNHVDKWYLSFKYEVSPCAKILRRRLGQQYTCRQLSESLVVMYDALPSTVSHASNARPLQLTDEQWDELFQFTGIYEQSNQKLLRMALAPITMTEYDETSVTDHYFLSVENIGIHLERNSEEDETENIKEKCGEYAKFVSNFYYPMNKARKYTNQVYFQVDRVTDQEINKLIERLQNLGSIRGKLPKSKSINIELIQTHEYSLYFFVIDLS